MVGLLTNFAEACKPAAAKFVPTWYKYLDGEMSGGKCNVKFSLPADFIKILLAIFDIVLFVGGIAAVAFVFIGGFQYLIGQGEPERSRNARTTIINALIGLVIVLSASAIVNLVGRNL